MIIIAWILISMVIIAIVVYAFLRLMYCLLSYDDKKICRNCWDYDRELKCCWQDGVIRPGCCRGCSVFRNRHKNTKPNKRQQTAPDGYRRGKK